MSSKPENVQRLFATWQIVIVTATLLLGALAYVISHYSGHNYIFGLIPFLDVARESSLPTFISVANLLLAAQLSFSISLAIRFQGENPSRYWMLLAAIFVFLAADEATMIHEKLEHLRHFFPESDSVSSRHDWLFAGVLLATLMILLVLPFLFKLPKRLALWFLTGGSVFAFGVIGMEYVGSVMLSIGIETGDFAYKMRRLIEEGAEMYGIVIYNCAASAELARRASNFELINRAGQA